MCGHLCRVAAPQGFVGQVFQGHRVRAGDEFGRVRTAGTESSASNTVARYPSGSCVVVYFDPANPANSALER